ncbi:MAG: hypothetical protein ACOCXG_00335 [Nanoarchaeota archaeon]
MEIRIILSFRLEDEINRIFKKQSIDILERIYSLKENPKQGKKVGKIGSLVIKELKFETFRFYFIVDGFKLKLIGKEDLKELVIRFVRMSKKNNQSKVIQEIRDILLKIGIEGF